MLKDVMCVTGHKIPRQSHIWKFCWKEHYFTFFVESKKTKCSINKTHDREYTNRKLLSRLTSVCLSTLYRNYTCMKNMAQSIAFQAVTVAGCGFQIYYGDRPGRRCDAFNTLPKKRAGWPGYGIRLLSEAPNFIFSTVFRMAPSETEPSIRRIPADIF
jgi:hypothetical protein